MSVQATITVRFKALDGEWAEVTTQPVPIGGGSAWLAVPRHGDVEVLLGPATTADSDINALMKRCVAEWDRWHDHPTAHVSEDFKIIYDVMPSDWEATYPGRPHLPWRVGFYSGHQGKVVFDAATLEEALLGWLEDNEGASENLA